VISVWDRRKEVVEASRRLAELGHMPATSGNVSVRLDERRILITPSGLPKSNLQPGQIDIVGVGGECLECSLKPTSELGLHLAVYRLRPDVQAVVHAHPSAATAYACAGVALPTDIAAEVLVALGVVPLTSFFMLGSRLTDRELPADLREAILTRDAALLGNHGAVTFGASLSIAFQNMELLEHYAKICLAVHQLGRQEHLSPAQAAELIELGKKYHRK
jgi:L-fuculose-phosphate aldolase